MPTDGAGGGADQPAESLTIDDELEIPFECTGCDRIFVTLASFVDHFSVLHAESGGGGGGGEDSGDDDHEQETNNWFCDHPTFENAWGPKSKRRNDLLDFIVKDAGFENVQVFLQSEVRPKESKAKQKVSEAKPMKVSETEVTEKTSGLPITVNPDSKAKPKAREEQTKAREEQKASKVMSEVLEAKQKTTSDEEKAASKGKLNASDAKPKAILEAKKTASDAKQKTSKVTPKASVDKNKNVGEPEVAKKTSDPPVKVSPVSKAKPEVSKVKPKANKVTPKASVDKNKNVGEPEVTKKTLKSIDLPISVTATPASFPGSKGNLPALKKKKANALEKALANFDKHALNSTLRDRGGAKMASPLKSVSPYKVTKTQQPHQSGAGLAKSLASLNLGHSKSEGYGKTRGGGGGSRYSRAKANNTSKMSEKMAKELENWGLLRKIPEGITITKSPKAPASQVKAAK